MKLSNYIVQYGLSAYVGRFVSDQGVSLCRGNRVVVRTPRGLELGEVLCSADERFTGRLDPNAGGELIRPARDEDRAQGVSRQTQGDTLLAVAETSGLPITFLDVEVTLDGSTAVLHVLPWESCNADQFLADLSERFGLAIRLLDVSRTPTAQDPPEKATSCGKPDCGSGNCSSCGTGGGCSTGSCSRGKVKSADDLTAYFADLRQKMEQAAGRTPLH